MTKRKKLDDSELLDLLLEGRDAEVESELDPDSLARLDALRRVHAGLLAVAGDGADHGLSEDAIAAVVRRADAAPAAAPTPVVPLRARRWRPIAVAAALVIVAALAWTAFGPGGATRAVEAGIFGGIELIRDGKAAISPVDHRLKIRPGDVILSRGGGELDIGDGYFLKVGQNTRLVCLQLSDGDLVLGLESGRLRCERVPAGRAQLTTHVGPDLTLKAGPGSIFAVQWMDRPDDQLDVDHGTVRVRCSHQHTLLETVTPETGAYSLRERCPSAKLPAAKQVGFEPCHKRGARPEFQPSLPTQTDLGQALALAEAHHFPVLVTREDGLDVSPCYRSCCFVDFLAKRRGLGGVVWLVLDPKRNADELARFNLQGDKNGVVVLNRHGEVMDRGHVESDDGMYAAVLDLIRSGRAKCKG